MESHTTDNCRAEMDGCSDAERLDSEKEEVLPTSSLTSSSSFSPMVDQLTIECPICMNDVAFSGIIYSNCCGQPLCSKCAHSIWTNKKKSCAFCRATHEEMSVMKSDKPWALYNTAVRLSDGHPRVSKEVYDLSLKALEGGILNALYYVGFALSRGPDDGGVEKSVDEAIKHLRRGSDVGHERCTFLLSLIYMELEDYEKARHYMKVADHQNLPGASHQLGEWYYHGLEGCPQDKEKALYYFKRASDGQWKPAQFFIATIYFYDRQFELCITYAKKCIEEQSALPESPPVIDVYVTEAMMYLGVSYSQIKGSSETGRFKLDSHYWLSKYLDRVEDKTYFQENFVSVYNITLDQLKSFCSTCGRRGTSGPLLKCAGCKVSHYCDKQCQRKNWEHHKVLCRKIQLK